MTDQEKHEAIVAKAQANVTRLLLEHDNDPRLALIALVGSETVAEILAEKEHRDWKQALQIAAYYAARKEG